MDSSQFLQPCSGQMFESSRLHPQSSAYAEADLTFADDPCEIGDGARSAGQSQVGMLAALAILRWQDRAPHKRWKVKKFGPSDLALVECQGRSENVPERRSKSVPLNLHLVSETMVGSSLELIPLNGARSTGSGCCQSQGWRESRPACSL